MRAIALVIVAVAIGGAGDRIAKSIDQLTAVAIIAIERTAPIRMSGPG